MPEDDDQPNADEMDDDEDADDEEAHALAGSLSGLLAQLGVASEQLDDVAEEASDTIVEGSSAGGSVVIQLTGSLDAVSIHIDPVLVDPTDVGMLEDAVLAALRDALAQVVELQAELAGELESAEMDLSGLLGRLGGLASFGGLGLPDLGDLGNPEDLIAGLSGALGNLPGGLVASFPPGLSDMMAGLGLAGSGTPAAAPNDSRTDETSDETPSEDDDSTPEA
ncbi:MAG: YbaB/EbfC family nucleoid-associated protein [Acidimicrobiales bacterium]|jgi:DNA-binding YbaB/EbfC family protein